MTSKVNKEYITDKFIISYKTVITSNLKNESTDDIHLRTLVARGFLQWSDCFAAFVTAQTHKSMVEILT